jgi:hypothetical protein
VKTIDLRPPAHSSMVDKKFNISSTGMAIVTNMENDTVQGNRNMILCNDTTVRKQECPG